MNTSIRLLFVSNCELTIKKLFPSNKTSSLSSKFIIIIECCKTITLFLLFITNEKIENRHWVDTIDPKPVPITVKNSKKVNSGQFQTKMLSKNSQKTDQLTS